MGRRGRKAKPGPTSHIEDLISSWLAQRPDLDMTDFLQGLVLMRAGRILDHAFNKMCQNDHGISAADMRVLFALRRAGEPFVRRPTDLFKALLVTSGTITKQVDRLTDKGFAERLADPDNAGGFLVKLTNTGRQVADEATNVLATKSLLISATENLGGEERAAGRAYLFEVLRALEQITTVGSDLPENN